MAQQALGMIETYGMVAAVEAADVALKTASVELINYEIVKSGRIMIAIYGEVAAVQASVTAGAAAAAKINTVFSQHVIPRPLAEPRLLIKHRDEGPGPDQDDPGPGPDSPGDGGGEAGQLNDAQKPEKKVTDRALRQSLEEMSVVALRQYARTIENIAIKGRQISKANKEQLIKEIMKAKKSK